MKNLKSIRRVLLCAGALVFAISLNTGCQTSDEAKAEEPVTAESAGTEAPAAVQAAAGKTFFEGCDIPVLATSPHAVGNPCMTTEKFMRAELKLPENLIAWVQANADRVGFAGGRPDPAAKVAH